MCVLQEAQRGGYTTAMRAPNYKQGGRTMFNGSPCAIKRLGRVKRNIGLLAEVYAGGHSRAAPVRGERVSGRGG